MSVPVDCSSMDTSSFVISRASRVWESLPSTAPTWPSAISSVKRATPLLIGALVLVAVGLWYFLRSKPRDYALVARQIATQRLAEHLGQKFPSQRVLLISNPFAQ